MMRMAVDDQVRPVSIHHFSQTRTAQIGINLRGFSSNCPGDGRVVEDDDPLGGPQLRHGAFELHGLVNRSLHKGLDLGLPESRQYTTAATADEALCSGESHPVPFIAGAVENLDSFRSHYPNEFGF